MYFQIFIGFVIKQFEFIEEGQIRYYYIQHSMTFHQLLANLDHCSSAAHRVEFCLLLHHVHNKIMTVPVNS